MNGDAGALPDAPPLVGSRGRRPLAAHLRDYLSLTKPRIIALLLVTTYCAMAVAARGLPPLRLALAVLAGVALSAGGAHALNMWYDRDIDRAMDRTRFRPLPARRIPPASAVRFGAVLELGSLAVLGRWAGVAADLLCLGGFVYYFGIYTLWLKRRTPQNIVIGGGAGAVPPLVGWAAVTGHLSLTAGALFLIIFLWTPAHFWSLALFRASEYRQAGVPMMPAVRGPAATKRQMLAYTVLLLGASTAPYWLGAAGPAYLAGSLALGLALLVCAAACLAEPPAATRWARRTFRCSVVYLGALFPLLALSVRP